MGSVVQIQKPVVYPEKLIERDYLKESRRNIYVALEDLDLVFDERIIPDVIQMWNGGLSITDIAKTYKRDPDEIACLIMSLAKEGRIKPRQGGAYGRRKQDGKKSTR